jgi:O-antigen/teichoic acid export membrane protein
VASILTDWITSPIGAGLIVSWTVLTGSGLFWYASRLSSTDGPGGGNAVRRIFRNSMIPIASQLLVRVVDLIVAIALLRLLGPTGNGQYAIAVVVWLYVKTISDFGLALLATREVARDPTMINTIVGETTIFRWLVLLVTGVPVAVYVFGSLTLDALSVQSALAIGLLYLSIIPASYAESANAALNGLERMEIAAVINIGISFARAPLAVGLGATALGVPGVAIAAVVTSILSAVAFHRALRSLAAIRPSWRLERQRMRYYAHESWPLLVNALLVSLFFRVDVFIIAAYRGDAALGIYDAAYKLINLMTIIPAYATLAVFPLMTQRANDARALARAQRVTTYTLITIAWVLVFSLTALSDVAVRILAGQAYLPEAALLLRILIWFAPISFVNGVFQYVLVAMNEQRRLVPAFMAAVTFNFAANMALVPLYGARASAALTIATEIVILVALILVSRGTVVRIDLQGIALRIWRPSVAGIAATAVALALREQPLLAIAASTAVFAVVALGVRVVGEEEKDLFHRLRARENPASS